MPTFDYRARCEAACVKEIFVPLEEVDRSFVKRSFDSGEQLCVHDEPYRRVFSTVRFSGYRNVLDPGAPSEQQFTSERQFKQALAEKGRRQEDRTGIPHNYEPVDINDPSVAPENPEAALKELHDKQVAAGVKDRTMRTG
ncbi:MAG: hypothetical protein ACF8PN_08210 [Phycisphaerales bacterium]